MLDNTYYLASGGAIHQVLEPYPSDLTCSGCLWTPELLGEDVIFVDFSAALRRGTLVRDDNFPVRMLNDAYLCSRCVTDAALLLNPEPTTTYHEAVEKLKGELGDRVAALTSAIKEQEKTNARNQREAQEAQAARDAQAAFEATVNAWVDEWDKAVKARETARRWIFVWTRAVRAGDTKAEAELKAEKVSLAAATAKLDALSKTGAALRDRCRERDLPDLARSVTTRVTKYELGEDAT